MNRCLTMEKMGSHTCTQSNTPLTSSFNRWHVTVSCSFSSNSFSRIAFLSSAWSKTWRRMRTRMRQETGEGKRGGYRKKRRRRRRRTHEEVKEKKEEGEGGKWRGGLSLMCLSHHYFRLTVLSLVSKSSKEATVTLGEGRNAMMTS